MDTAQTLIAIQQTLASPKLRGAYVTGRWAQWLEGAADQPAPEESLTLVLVTEEGDIDRRALAKLSDALEKRIGVSEVYISRVTQTEWNAPKDDSIQGYDFVQYTKRAPGLLLVSK